MSVRQLLVSDCSRPLPFKRRVWRCVRSSSHRASRRPCGRPPCPHSRHCRRAISTRTLPGTVSTRAFSTRSSRVLAAAVQAPAGRRVVLAVRQLQTLPHHLQRRRAQPTVQQRRVARTRSRQFRSRVLRRRRSSGNGAGRCWGAVGAAWSSRKCCRSWTGSWPRRRARGAVRGCIARARVRCRRCRCWAC